MRFAIYFTLLLILACLALVMLAYAGTSPRPACPNVEPWITPSPVLESACASPSPYEQFHTQDQPVYVPNSYTLASPDPKTAPGWVLLALPSGRWLVHSAECVLDPWVAVNYHSAAPTTAGINDCPLDAWIWQSDVACNQNDLGQCDITLDPTYQDWLDFSEHQ